MGKVLIHLRLLQFEIIVDGYVIVLMLLLQFHSVPVLRFFYLKYLLRRVVSLLEDKNRGKL